jgi:hypothetical protein
MAETRITVEWCHIAAGQHRAAVNPLALAARLAFPAADWVVCGTQTLYLTLAGRRYEYALPAEASYALGLFYDTGFMDPFSFTAGAPVFSYPFRLAGTAAGRRVA